MEVRLAGFPPFPVVSTGSGTASHTIAAQFQMILTIHLALLAQPWTSGEAAGPFRFLRHKHLTAREARDHHTRNRHSDSLRRGPAP